MPFTLANQMVVGLYLEGGQEVPLDPTLYTQVSMIQNNKNQLPVMQLGIFDILGLSQKTGLFFDGKKIQLKLGPNSQIGSAVDYNFRIFSTKLAPTGKGPFVEVTAMYDAPAYLGSVNKQAFPKQPSSSVISALAGKVGLGADVDSTSDVMTWLPNNKKIGQYVRHVVDHGFAGAGSCMMHAVTEKAGQFLLRYKDVTKQGQMGAMATFVNDSGSSGNQFLAMQHDVKSYGGFLNNMYGYGSQSFESLLKGELNDFSKVAANLGSGDSFNINSAVKGLVGNVRNEFRAFNMGNVHEKFQEAKHQNSRLRSTYSIVLSVMTDALTNLSIFDPVEVNFLNYQTGQRDVVYNGKYLVSAKTQFVKGTDYRERLLLTTQSFAGGSEGGG